MLTVRTSYERENDDETYVLISTWVWDAGADVGESPHPMNGYGKGWSCEEIRFEDERGRDVTYMMSNLDFELASEYLHNNVDTEEFPHG